MRVDFDDGVVEDLKAIELYIAQDNMERAISFVNELIEEAEKLAVFPYKGTRISEKLGEAYRQLHYEGYTIYYKVEESEITVLEIFQQSKEIHRLQPR